ncbi:MAG: hypothetical protein ACOZQL_35360 [Myxococcota bacterium]
MSLDLTVVVTRRVSRASVNTALAQLGAWFTLDDEPESIRGGLSVSATRDGETEAVGSIDWSFDGARTFSLSAGAGDDGGARDELLAWVLAAALRLAGDGELVDPQRGGAVSARTLAARLKPLVKGRAAFERRVKRRAASRRPGESSEDRALRDAVRWADEPGIHELLTRRVTAALASRDEAALRHLARVMPREARWIETVLDPLFASGEAGLARRLLEELPPELVGQHVRAAVSFSGVRALGYVRFLAEVNALTPELARQLPSKNPEIAAWLRALSGTGGDPGSR